MRYWKEQMISTKVGRLSLIGTGRERPVSWGNYFWVRPEESDKTDRSDIRILNMWAENLESAVVEFNLGNEILALVHDDAAVIIDPRIPDNWKYNKLCFTGGSGLKTDVVESLREIYTHLGDPTNEFEQFIDPVAYWSKRGGTYHNGIVSYKLGDKKDKVQ